jgi:hypothetical protein
MSEATEAFDGTRNRQPPPAIKAGLLIGCVLAISLDTALSFAQSSTTSYNDFPAAQVDSITSDQVRLQRKSIAIGLLEEARRAAIRGDEARARNLVRKAADIPTIWDSNELTPERFLRELDRRGSAFADADTAKKLPRSLRSVTSPADPNSQTNATPSSDERDATLNSDEDDSAPQAFRRSSKGDLPTTFAPEASTSDAADQKPVENLTTIDSNFVETVAASSDVPIDAPELEFREIRGPSSDRVLDVRVHDFSPSNNHAETGTLPPFVVSFTSLLAALLAVSLILAAGVYVLLRRLASRGGIVVRIEIGTSRMPPDEASADRSRLLRLAPMSAEDCESQPAAAPELESAAQPANPSEPAERQGPRNPGGGAAA